MEAKVAAGDRVVANRREFGLSQEALAAADGVTRQAIGAIESGRTQPGMALARAIEDRSSSRAATSAWGCWSVTSTRAAPAACGLGQAIRKQRICASPASLSWSAMLRSNAYRRDLEAFRPYDTQRMGEQID